MQTATRRRMTSAIVLSVAAHLAVLAVLAVHAPRLQIPDEPGGPPVPIIPLLILPRTPPPAAGSSQPSPIRLHRRPQRFAVDLPTIAPLPVPQKALAPPPADPAPPGPIPPPPLTSEVRQTLRLGAIGCANAGALNLSRAEREACDEQLASGAKDAPFLAPLMSAAKRADLQAAAARKEAVIQAREAPLANAYRPPQPEPQDYSGEPYITGSGQSAIGAAQHPPSKRAARKLQPLPP